MSYLGMLVSARPVRLVVALAVTVALGIVSRRWPIGWWPYDKSLGDVLYAVAAYLAFALLLWRWGPARAAPLALVACLAVETFQATGIPARFAHIGLVRWVLGTTFAWHDIACYVIGVAFIAAIDLLMLHRPRFIR